MKIIIFISLLFFGINGFAQTDTIKLVRKEAIRLDSIGFQLHKIKTTQKPLIILIRRSKWIQLSDKSFYIVQSP